MEPEKTGAKTSMALVNAIGRESIAIVLGEEHIFIADPF